MIGSITRLWDHSGAINHALLPDDGPRPKPVAGSPDLWQAADGVLQPAGIAEALRRPLRSDAYRPTPSDRLVWCCTLRQEPGEAPLSDTDWAWVSHRVIAAAGLSADLHPSGGCPWVAIRTSAPHRLIVVATLMRADGSRPDLHHSTPRVRAVLQSLTRSSLPFRAAASRTLSPSAATTSAASRHRR